MLNTTILPEQIVACHQATAIPALVIFYVLISIINIIFGLIFVKTFKIKNYLTVWFLLLIINALVLVFLVYMPALIQTIWGWFV